MAELTTDLIVQEQTYKARTYGLSETKIEGFVDELAALKQAIYKILSTEQYEYPIYSFKYGIAWKELIGEERAYVRAEMRRMIEPFCRMTGSGRWTGSGLSFLETAAIVPFKYPAFTVKYR